jgi:Mor family transcriptional regulator
MTPSVLDDEDPIAIIEQEARAMAQCFGVARADEAAASLVDRILLRLGGELVYLPKRSARNRKRDREELIRKFTGNNLLELAREYGVTARHLRRILTEATGGRRDPGDAERR